MALPFYKAHAPLSLRISKNKSECIIRRCLVCPPSTRRGPNPRRAALGRPVVAPPALSIARRWLSSEADKTAKPAAAAAAAVAETAAKEVVVVKKGGSSLMQRLGAFLAGAGLGCGVGYYHLANVSCCTPEVRPRTIVLCGDFCAIFY